MIWQILLDFIQCRINMYVHNTVNSIWYSLLNHRYLKIIVVQLQRGEILQIANFQLVSIGS